MAAPLDGGLCLQASSAYRPTLRMSGRTAASWHSRTRSNHPAEYPSLPAIVMITNIRGLQDPPAPYGYGMGMAIAVASIKRRLGPRS